ncbi:MAG: transposase [Jatrophihabitans sp.]|uniref:transposase n=1 Tax=Jatrophihabitans sp. TaxID=1932789 RepID=UPI0039154D01
MIDRRLPSEPRTEAAAYELLERLRWGGGAPSCPHCGAGGRSHYLAPAAGTSRPTRTGTRSERRVWKCGACRRQFSVLVGTVLQGTRISVRTWVAVAQAARGPEGSPTPGEVARRHGLSRDGARQLIRRLDLAFQRRPVEAGDDPLAALLRIPAAEADRIRAATPPRVRPRPQLGPSADYGPDRQPGGCVSPSKGRHPQLQR